MQGLLGIFFSPAAGGLLLLLAAACASGGQRAQCAAINWEQLGRQDGEEGRPVTWIEKHQDKCAGEGLLANTTLYRRGYEQGLQSYCTPTSGYRVGTFARTYENVCPDDLEPAFLGGMNIGRKIHAVRVRQGEIDNRLAAIDARLAANIAASERQDLLREKGGLQLERQTLETRLGRIKVEAKDYIDSRRKAVPET